MMSAAGDARQLNVKSDRWSGSYVIVVYKDIARRAELHHGLAKCRFTVRSFADPEDAVDVVTALPAEQPLVMVVNRNSPSDPLERLLAGRRASQQRVPTIITTYERSVPQSVKAMQCGAVDLLVEPFSVAELREALVRTLDSYWPRLRAMN